MNYLYINRDNSTILPFDVMNIIYEFADPLPLIKYAIINKSYCLDDIMYKKMRKIIEKTFTTSHNDWGLYIIFYTYFTPRNILTPSNINNENMKQDIINYYKKLYLFASKQNKICGLYPHGTVGDYRYKLINDIAANGHPVNRKYSTKQLYKKWVKL
jgi:hypothetical protein